MFKSVAELKKEELLGKKVLLRVDFNIPVLNGEISEIYRLEAVKETIEFLKSRGAVTALASHIAAVDSFKVVSRQIEKILGIDFNFIEDCIGGPVLNNLSKAKPGDVFLLENIRKYSGEENNDSNFAKELAKPFDVYINDAFAVSHRNHASLVAITKFLPSYAGLLLIKEIENLKRAINTPKDGKTLILGGAKIETKFPVIKNFLDKADNILIGGAVANVFLKAKGIDIKKSLTDDKFLTEAAAILKNSNLIVPTDYVMADDMILDIGMETTGNFIKLIKESKMIIWNGPLGKTEDERFSIGSQKISEAIIDSGVSSIVGGGDTIAFLEKLKLIGQLGYVSTGGGAMLEFLAGNKLPGLMALGFEI